MNLDTSTGKDEIRKKGFNNLILVVVLLLVFLMASRTPLDSDMWWHLRSGQIMVENGKPLLTDVFSYTRAGAEWTNHSWLGEVLLYIIFQIAGWLSLSTWMGVTAALIAWFIWKQIPVNGFLRVGFVLFASIVSAPLWTPRPQFFSLLFLSGLAWWIASDFQKPARKIWLLLPFFILWSNIHAGFVLGILLLITCALGVFLDGISRDKPDRNVNLVKARLLAACAAGGYAVAAINPNGIKMWFIPFETVGVDVLRQFIQEWASPDFHSPEVWAFAALISLLIIGLALNSQKMRFQNLIPGVFFLLLSLYARRNIAAAAVVITPWLASIYTDIFAKIHLTDFLPEKIRYLLRNFQNDPSTGPSHLLARILNLSIVGLLSLVCFVKLFAVSQLVLVDAFIQKSMPTEAVNFLKSSPRIAGQLFNSYNWGGYLIYTLPGQKVFIDGRTDLFGDEILGEWLKVVQAGDGWEKILQQRGVSRILIEPDRPLAKILPFTGWKEIYRDSIAVIFEKMVQ
jgi:hypothetical protein